MDLGVAGRVGLVTGSSRGLGRATAAALAAEGVRLVICGRDAANVAQAAAELGQVTDVLAVAADVTDPASPARLVATALDRFGRLDILVGNTGGPPRGRALELDDAALEAALNANLLTSVRLVREAVPHMQGWGRICLIASWTVKQPEPTLALSNTARTGLWAWAKTAAADLFARGITLNLACPSHHLTERLREVGVPDAPIGDPADFGRVVAFLCSQPAAFVSGSAVMVDGARSVGLL